MSAPSIGAASPPPAREEPAPGARVPLMDPQRVYAAWGPQAEQEVTAILRSHAYVKGRHVEAIESEVAEFVGAAHGVAVDSGTDALFLTLRAILDERPAGQREVILPTFTFVATASAVVNAGGTPIFADVDLETCNMDLETLRPHISARTAAVVPVHLFGNPVDVAALKQGVTACREELNGDDPGEIFFLEDAAQAIDASLGGIRAGALGDAATFSFYPSKNLGAAGDGGMVTTGSADLAAAVRALRDHGQTRKLYDHEWIGTNSRMDEIQAAVLRIKLPHLPTWTRQRQDIALCYDAAFAGTPIHAQRVASEAASAYHLYTVRVEAGPGSRDRLREALAKAGIASGIYYPLPLHRQTCFAALGSWSCPQADRLSETVLSLPCFPELGRGEQQRVIDEVLAFLD